MASDANSWASRTRGGSGKPNSVNAWAGRAAEAAGYNDEYFRQKDEEKKRKKQEEQVKQQEEAANADKRGLFSRLWDQANYFDSGRSFVTATPSEEQAKRSTIDQSFDPAKAMFPVTGQIINTAAEGSRRSVELGRIAAANITENKDARKAAIRRATDKSASYLNEGSGLLGLGGLVNNDFVEGNMGVGDLSKVLLAKGMQGAAEWYPSSKGGSLLARPLEGRIANTVTRGVLEGAGSGLLGNLGGQLLDEQAGINPEQALVSALTGGAVGGLIPGIGLTLKGAGKGMAGAVTDAVTPVTQRLTDAIAPYKNPLDRVVSNAMSAATRPVRESAVGQKVARYSDKFSSAWIDKLNSPMKALKAAEQSGKADAGTLDAFNLQATMARRYAPTTDALIDADPRTAAYFDSIRQLDPNDKVAREAAGRYAIASEELRLMDEGVKKKDPVRAAEFESELDNLDKKYGADKLEAARQSFIDLQALQRETLAGVGIDEDTFLKWEAEQPEYITMAREQPEYRLNNPYVRQGSGTNTAKLKRGESTAQAIDPLAAFYARMQNTVRFVEENKVKTMIAQALEQAGEAKRVVSTEKVLARREAFQFLSDTKEGKDLAARLAKKYGKQVRRLESEMKSIKGQAYKEVEKKLAKATKGRLVPSQGASAENIKGIIAEIMSSDMAVLNRLNKKYLNREPKLAALIEELTTAKNDLEAFSTVRRGAYKDILKNADIKTSEPTITFYDRGIENKVVVDPEIEAAVKNFNTQQTNSILEATRKMNNVFKYGTTQGNPAFAIPNYIKDQFFSSINSESVWRTHNPINVVESIIDGFRMATGRDIPDPDMQSVAGALQGSTRLDIYKKLKTSLNEIDDNIGKGRTAKGKIQNITIGKAGRKAVSTWETLQSTLEYATRIQNAKGTQKLYLSKNMPKELANNRALLAAFRNSTDFAPSGDMGRVMNMIAPYLNAGIQGTRTLGRSLKERPVTTTMKIATLATPAVLLANYNMSDPERAKTYFGLPEHVRNNNFVMVSGNKAFLIPLPPGVSGLISAVRSVQEAQFAENPNLFKTVAQNLLDAVSPINARNPMGAVSAFLPGPAKAALEIGANKNFYSGQEIVPEYIQAQNPDPSQQKYDSTSGVAQRIASVLGVSPLQVEHFMRQTGGELFGTVAPNAIDAAAGYDAGGVAGAMGSRIERRFMADTSKSNDIKNQFNNQYYKLQSRMDKKEREVGSLIAQGNYNEAIRKADEFNAYVDNQFQDYFRTYGQYADPTYADRVNNLKIGIQVSKRGKPYIKY